jgi:hypothetical protein
MTESQLNLFIHVSNMLHLKIYSYIAYNSVLTVRDIGDLREGDVPLVPLEALDSVALLPQVALKLRAKLVWHAAARPLHGPAKHKSHSGQTGGAGKHTLEACLLNKTFQQNYGGKQLSPKYFSVRSARYKPKEDELLEDRSPPSLFVNQRSTKF